MPSGNAIPVTGPLTPEVIAQAKNVCSSVMKNPGQRPKDPEAQLQQGEKLLNQILAGFTEAGIPVRHPDLNSIIEEVCGWLQSAYIDGGEPRERRRALAKQCDQLATPLPLNSAAEQPAELAPAEPAAPEGMSGAFQFEEQTDGADSANYFGGCDGGVPQPDAPQPAKNGHVPSGGDDFGGFGSAQAASSDFGAPAEPASDFGSFDTAGTQQPQQAPPATAGGDQLVGDRGGCRARAPRAVVI